MSLAYFVKQLDDDEILKAVIYRSAWMAVPTFLIAIAFIWVPLFFFFRLQSQFGQAGINIGLIVVVIGVFIFIRQAMILKYTAWVITNKRLIDFSQKGFWRSEVNEEPLKNLYKPYSGVTKLWERICGCSTIKIMLIHERAFLEISGVSNYKEIVDFLKTIVPDYIKEKKKLKSIHDSLSDDEFELLLEEMSEE